MLFERGKGHATRARSRSNHALQMDGIDNRAELGEDRALGLLKPGDPHD